FRSFARVRITKSDEGYVADPVRVTGSGILSSMSKANGLVMVPEDKGGLEEGELVDVYLFTPFEVGDE
ncbi:MAG: molybdopterin molybdenumtransferase MoeA, partial [Candidatus Bathyarchaeia archaeon]